MKRTDVVVLLDRSGSMQARKDDHEGGLKSFIEDQKSLDGDVRLTLIQFDTTDPCEVIHDATPIADVDGVRLIPRGGTPLLDAMLLAAAHAEKNIPADSNVIFMVITDGEENSSREASRDAVKDCVKSLEAKGWVFLFLGAGIDAFAEAAKAGVAMDFASPVVNTKDGVQAMYANVTNKVWASRTSSAKGQSLRSAELQYAADERSNLTSGNAGAEEIKTSGLKADYQAAVSSSTTKGE